jgi:hypothetical protein
LQNPFFLSFLQREADIDLGGIGKRACSERRCPLAVGIRHAQGFTQAFLKGSSAAGGNGPAGAVRGTSLFLSLAHPNLNYFDLYLNSNSSAHFRESGRQY